MKVPFCVFLLLSAVLSLNAQGLQDSGQRVFVPGPGTSVAAVTPRTFTGCGAPGSVVGSLARDLYVDTCASPAAAYFSVAAGQWQAFAASAAGCTQYDVVCNYHASGSAATTNGMIAMGGNSLIVSTAATFAVDEGIFIAGAAPISSANPNGNLITSITGVAGNTITLAAAASVSVSGALVQHDDTAAINAAIADAWNNRGGMIWFRASGVDGIYRCSGIANSVTGGILTFPQNVGGNTAEITVALMGEVKGKFSGDYLSVLPGGVSLDFHNAPNVAGTSAISPAPYVQVNSSNFTTIFEPVEVLIDGMNWFLPAQTKVNGIMLANALQASIGDHVYVLPQADSAGTFNRPTGNSTGIWMPQAFNDIAVSIGHASTGFFNHCFVPGELTRLGKPEFNGCNVAMYMYATVHDIEGEVVIQSSSMILAVDSGVTSPNIVPVNFTLDAEGYGPGWSAPASQVVVDPGNRLMGEIDYLYYAPGPGANGMQFLSRNGALNVNLHNKQSIALYGASGYPLPACNANLENDKEVVYDALSPTYLGTYVSGGAVVSPVICNGSNWVTY